ncbi:MAG: hypothetical protein U9O94_11005, partial [Nanoarchaeota archaeon]|nr:hypothetical protein [Nanoarchaeota archaeon]
MNNLEKSIITTAVLIVLAILFSFIEPTIIGYVVKGTTLSYSDDVSLVVSSDRDYTWFLEHPGDVTSVRVDGRIQDQGSAKVYIEKDGVRYLIYDSFDLGGGMLGVTGFAIIDTFNNNSINQSIVDEIIINEIIINETIINQSLDENLTINNETLENNSIINETIINQTNNNETINNQSIVNETITKNIIITMQGGGSIDVGGMFEFNVSSEFDWDVNYDKVCTKWDINSVSMCYGAADCCALIGLASLGEWDDSFYLSYERYGSGLDNIVRSQVIYADYSIEVESAYSDIAYSGIDSKEADFYHETISFSDACEETCLVSGFNKTFYKIIIDVENTTLYLDRIRYSIHKEINEVPMLVNNISNMTVERDGSLELNLDDYFMDPENATLLYSYYKPYGFNVTLEDNMLTITPEEDFTESGFMFVTANGSEQIAVSNVFRIDVGKKIKQEKNLTLKAIKKDFKSSENARFNFKFPKANNKTKKVVNKKQLSKWESEDQTIEAKILDNQDNITGLVAEINELADGEFEIILPQKREFRPGLYSLEINFSRSGENTIIKQNFTWGVLAINTHKSMYTENENAFITMGVLDDQGFMVCNASVVLDIIDPNGVKTTLTTANGDIIVTEACYIYDVTERPDYYTNYDVGGVGTYTMNLTATTFNGVRSISDSVNVYNKVDFDVARDGHTRIFPYVPYIMNFTIKANKNYNGDIVEYVPASFNISSQDGMSISEVGDVKEIRWNKNLKKGDTINLDYEYDAPDISPEFYLLGEMEIGNWKEERYWQIASDKNWFYDGTYTASPAPINELEKTNISMDFSVSKAGGWTIDLQDNVLG